MPDRIPLKSWGSLFLSLIFSPIENLFQTLCLHAHNRELSRRPWAPDVTCTWDHRQISPDGRPAVDSNDLLHGHSLIHSCMAINSIQIYRLQ